MCCSCFILIHDSRLSEYAYRSSTWFIRFQNNQKDLWPTTIICCVYKGQTVNKVSYLRTGQKFMKRKIIFFNVQTFFSLQRKQLLQKVEFFFSIHKRQGQKRLHLKSSKTNSHKDVFVSLNVSMRKTDFCVCICRRIDCSMFKRKQNFHIKFQKPAKFCVLRNLSKQTV